MTKGRAAAEERGKILRKARQLLRRGGSLPDLIDYIVGRAKRNKAKKGGL